MAADVVFIGGVARNAAFRDVLLERLGLSVHVPQDPQRAAAIGCALLAREAEYRRAQEGSSMGRQHEPTTIRSLTLSTQTRSSSSPIDQSGFALPMTTNQEGPCRGSPMVNVTGF